MVAVQIFLWILAVVTVVFTIWSGMIRSKDKDYSGDRPIVGFKANRAILAVLIIFVVACISASFGQIEAGWRGVELKFGAPTGNIYGEGFYTLRPVFVKTVAHMNVQTQEFKAKASAASKDMQVVTTEVTLNYSLDPTKVVNIYRTLRYDMEPKIINPAVSEAVKAATATFTAEELITKRPEVRESIDSFLSDRFEKFGVIIQAMSITDFDFSDSFNSAIEAKVTAQQNALKAERDLIRIRTEAQQKIESAKAEAESLRLQKSNITEDLLRLRAIEVQQKAVDKWDGKLPITVAGGNSVPFINIPSR